MICKYNIRVKNVYSENNYSVTNTTDYEKCPSSHVFSKGKVAHADEVMET
jgi:hypothetical protein